MWFSSFMIYHTGQHLKEDLWTQRGPCPSWLSRRESSRELCTAVKACRKIICNSMQNLPRLNKIWSNLCEVVLHLTQPATICIIRNCFSKIIRLFSDLAKTRTVSQMHHHYCLVMSERMGIAFPAYSPMLGCERVPKWVAGSLNSWDNEQLYNLLWESHHSSLWGFSWRRGKEPLAETGAKRADASSSQPSGWNTDPVQSKPLPWKGF